MRSLEKRHCSCILTALLEYSSFSFSPFVTFIHVLTYLYLYRFICFSIIILCNQFIYYVTCSCAISHTFEFYDGIHISIYLHESNLFFVKCFMWDETKINLNLNLNYIMTIRQLSWSKIGTSWPPVNFHGQKTNTSWPSVNFHGPTQGDNLLQCTQLISHIAAY